MFKSVACMAQKAPEIRQVKHLQIAEVQKVNFYPTSSFHMVV